MLVIPTVSAPLCLQYLKAFSVSAVSPGEGKDLKHSIKTITTCDASDLIGQELPDCDIKKTTSSRNIGVVLSRKSEANSTTTGSSVSSSNNCLVCEEDN